MTNDEYIKQIKRSIKEMVRNHKLQVAAITYIGDVNFLLKLVKERDETIAKLMEPPF